MFSYIVNVVQNLVNICIYVPHIKLNEEKKLYVMFYEKKIKSIICILDIKRVL